MKDIIKDSFSIMNTIIASIAVSIPVCVVLMSPVVFIWLILFIYFKFSVWWAYVLYGVSLYFFLIIYISVLTWGGRKFKKWIDQED